MTRLDEDNAAASLPAKKHGAQTKPERKDPLAPSTSHEYANGDRGDKSGENLDQQKAASGTPGTRRPGT